MQKDNVCYKTSDATDLYKELIQVAAVASAMAGTGYERRKKMLKQLIVGKVIQITSTHYIVKDNIGFHSFHKKLL
ncbi:hypothetical protein KHA80_03095 [Anaerobacillus sp. HL2]|nr:hypothetical protein KHA80_03095 [Anaerobacillus sp. HL2]